MEGNDTSCLPNGGTTEMCSISGEQRDCSDLYGRFRLPPQTKFPKNGNFWAKSAPPPQNRSKNLSPPPFGGPGGHVLVWTVYNSAFEEVRILWQNCLKALQWGLRSRSFSKPSRRQYQNQKRLYENNHDSIKSARLFSAESIGGQAQCTCHM